MLVVVLSVLFVLDILILIVALNLLRKTVGKNLKWSLIITGITFMMFVPAVMALLMKKVSIFAIAPGGIEEWIPFWGSYFGGIIGFAGVLFTTIYIVDKSTKNVEKQLEHQKTLHEKELREMERRLQEQKKEELEMKLNNQIEMLLSYLKDIHKKMELMKEAFLEENYGGSYYAMYNKEIFVYLDDMIMKFKSYSFQNYLFNIYLIKYYKNYSEEERYFEKDMIFQELVKDLESWEKEVKKGLNENRGRKSRYLHNREDGLFIIEKHEEFSMIIEEKTEFLYEVLLKVNN